MLDRILPKKWMYPVYQRQWQLLLRTDQGIDRGPQNFTSEEFDKVCLRCGRTLNVSGNNDISNHYIIEKRDAQAPFPPG